MATKLLLKFQTTNGFPQRIKAPQHHHFGPLTQKKQLNNNFFKHFWVKYLVENFDIAIFAVVKFLKSKEYPMKVKQIIFTY
ncbi:MAG: hypothetical protein ACI4TR_04835 [Bacteroidaceae bacterium]